LTPSAALATNTTYTATVKSGASGVKDAAGNPLAADKVWSFTTAGTSAPTPRYVSDLTWISSTNGWGPVERDKSNGEAAAGDGVTIRLNGQAYSKGLGVHSNSDVRVYLGGICTAFTASVGVDDEVGNNGSVIFQVWADGVKLYDSGTRYGWSPTAAVNVPLSTQNELALIVTDAGNGAGYDHADWADAQVTCSPDVTPPSVPTTTPAAGATGIAVSANVVATFSEPVAPATVTTTNVTLVRQGTTTNIASAVTYNVATRTVTLNPNANLLSATTYVATIKSGATGVKDLAGNAMAADKVWTFTTQ
jgi:hypothetical protein